MHSSCGVRWKHEQYRARGKSLVRDARETATDASKLLKNRRGGEYPREVVSAQAVFSRGLSPRTLR